MNRGFQTVDGSH